MFTCFKRPALVMALAIFFAAGVTVTPALADTPQIDFGDDSGDFINDGECDDIRFEGDGATTAGAPGTDATDCRTLYAAGAITVRASMNEGLTAPDFGDDSGDYIGDGDCDDPRFEGYRTTTLGAPGTDATDCRALWEQGLIGPRTPLNEGLEAPDFGNDSGQFAFDGECDDPRFEGPGASSVGTAGTDATDCADAWAAGTITLAPEIAPEDNPNAIVFDGIVFGDNSSSWANDGECDDPRFTGEGMASILADEDLGRDATDCLVLYVRGEITLAD